MTKIVMISDTHTYHHDLELPDADILFHCGDFTLMGNPLEVLNFNDWLGTLKQFNHIVVIAGNHDKCVGEDPMFGYKQLTNAIYLQNSGVDLEGFYIWGSPMTPSFHGMRGGLTFYTNAKENRYTHNSAEPNVKLAVVYILKSSILSLLIAEFLLIWVCNASLPSSVITKLALTFLGNGLEKIWCGLTTMSFAHNAT